MAAIARGQENTTGILNWFITVNCQLTDAFEVGFQIWDVTGGAPGTQVFPTTPGDWENVTNAPGHFSVGSYYAYDNGNAEGWTPGLAEPLGTHQIKWRWKITSGSPYQSNLEEFEVLVESAGSSADTYCTVQDIRDLGLAEADYPDATVLASIETWQQFLDRACRQWFNARSLTIQVDGNDSDTLWLGVPIIGLDYIKINDDTAELDTTLYRIYSNSTYPDDRRNPRIKLVKEFDDIFRGVRLGEQLRFRRGRKNQEIKGIFGFVESDGSVPKLIKRALCKLVVEKLTNPIFGTPPGSVMPIPAVLGPVIEERTDNHLIKYGGALAKTRAGLSGITNDQEIHDIIKLYRAPIGVATPIGWRD